MTLAKASVYCIIEVKVLKTFEIYSQFVVVKDEVYYKAIAIAMT